MEDKLDPADFLLEKDSLASLKRSDCFSSFSSSRHDRMQPAGSLRVAVLPCATCKQSAEEEENNTCTLRMRTPRCFGVDFHGIWRVNTGELMTITQYRH